MMFTRDLSLAALGLGLMITGCGGSGDETPDDTATPTAAGATDTPTEAATPTATVAPSFNVTFTVDTTTMADGTNTLATVEAGEFVYIVGDFKPNGAGCSFDNDATEPYPCWKPQRAELAMTETETAGVFAITLALTAGATVEYKYVKTTSDPDGNAWGNGVKDYFTTTERPCPGFEEATGGLWEIQNLTYTVPSDDAAVETYVVDAWRDYATDTYSYPSCD